MLRVEQSDQGLPCLLFHLHVFDKIPSGLLFHLHVFDKIPSGLASSFEF